MKKPVTIYEVYPKRALQEPIDTLVMLDRDNEKRRAIASARKWGACVVRVKAIVITIYPFTRQVISSTIIYVHKPRREGNPDEVTRKQLMGKIRSNNKGLYRGYRR